MKTLKYSWVHYFYGIRTSLYTTFFVEDLFIVAHIGVTSLMRTFVFDIEVSHDNVTYN